MTQSSLKCLHGKEVKMNAMSRINERKNKEFRIIKKNQQLIIWGKKTTKICKFIKDMNINYPLINLQTRLNSIPTKILTQTFMEVDKPTMKFISNSRGSKIARRLKEEYGLNLPHYEMRTGEERRAQRGVNHMCLCAHLFCAL